MKKILYAACTALLLVGATSCCGDSPLTASSAKKALKKEAMFSKNNAVVHFDAGFQEVTSSELDNLAMLKAAGVIDYTTEVVTEYTTSRQWVGGWYYGSYQTVENKTEHTFANVTLTEAGKKYVIEEDDVVSQRADQMKDFKANKDWEEEIPDYLNATHSSAPAQEEEAVVEEVVEAVAVDSAVTVDEFIEEVAEEVTPEPEPEPVKASNKNAAYEAALAKVNVETVIVRIGTIELVKVKEVLCTDDMFEAGRGTCSFIYKVAEVTPFGYVFGGNTNKGLLQLGKAEFVLYNDLGWTVSDIDL